MEFNREVQDLACEYTTTDGETRFAGRKVERFSYANGKVSRTNRRPIVKAFNPAFSGDGQALAGTGALVFEGEILGR